MPCYWDKSAPAAKVGKAHKGQADSAERKRASQQAKKERIAAAAAANGMSVEDYITKCAREAAQMGVSHKSVYVPLHRFVEREVRETSRQTGYSDDW